MVVLFFVLALTGCAVATGAPTWVPVTGSHSAGPSSSPQIGGRPASGSASLSAPSVVGGGSFPRSFLIPGTETSIRIGGS
jgi:hypothetical protein